MTKTKPGRVTDPPCRVRSQIYKKRGLAHKFSTHEKVTSPTGRVIIDRYICSCCGRPRK